MAILTHFLLRSENNAVSICGTDLDVTAVAHAPATIHAEGAITIKAAGFADVVRELPEGPVTIKVANNERVEVVSGGVKFKLIGYSAAEFPTPPGVGFPLKVKVPAIQLLEMIQKTFYAASTDETRFNLNGILFEQVPASKQNPSSQLRLVASDGHRLSVVSRPCPPLSIPERVIAPRKGLTELKKVLEEDPGVDVEFDLIQGFLSVKTPRVQVSMRLIDGDFPDYQQIVPQTPGTVVGIPSKELEQALRRMALLATDKTRRIRLDLSPGLLRLSTSSADIGDGDEEIQVSYDGPIMSVAFNVKYLLDIASVVSEDRIVQLELRGSSGGVTAYLSGDSGFYAVVMPMRLDN
jgi:DNA polymerase-3 subunit beta